MLKCVAYISTATSKFDSELLADLLKTCTINNAINDITGMLCYHNYSFLQFLEGEEEVLKRVYAKIDVDKRHKNVQKLFDQVIEERAFPNWAMGLSSYESLNAEQQLIFQDLSKVNIKLDAKYSQHTKAVSTFLRVFKNKQS